MTVCRDNERDGVLKASSLFAIKDWYWWKVRLKAIDINNSSHTWQCEITVKKQERLFTGKEFVAIK